MNSQKCIHWLSSKENSFIDVVYGDRKSLCGWQKKRHSEHEHNRADSKHIFRQRKLFDKNLTHE